MQIMIAVCWFLTGWMCAFAVMEWGRGERWQMIHSLVVAASTAAAAISLAFAP